MIKTLSIDLETFSDVDLKKGGVYKYVESPLFDILLFGASVNGGECVVYDLAQGEEIPEAIKAALVDKHVVKSAFNASFERICLSRYLGIDGYLDPDSWRCTMIWAAYNGLPLSLEKAGAALHLEEQKLKEGKELVRYFCTPCKPTKSNGGRTRNLPQHAPEKWELFKKYNQRDVQVEQQIGERLSAFPVPDFVWDEYHLDQRINDRGILIDRQLVEKAVEIDALVKEELTMELKNLTGLENPNSVVQLKAWLEARGIDIESLGKKEVAKAITDAADSVREALLLRQQLAKSSVKKYQAMQNAACADDHCRGMFSFYGANRSGRWSGRIVQLQNLYRNSMPDLAQARALLRSGDYEMLRLLYGSVPEVLSELIRTAFIPAPGYKFIVSDFSAIEARVLAYLAGEQWVLDVFHRGGDIYCETASRMFGVPVEKHGVNADLRQKGKQATLSCGYGGSVGALRAMGALDAGMKEEELQPLVNAWRTANPRIVRFWWNLDTAVKRVVKEHGQADVGSLHIYYKSGVLLIRLPSGRELAYVKPQIGENRYGGESVTYMGYDATKHWSRIETFGGKLVENCLAGSTLVVTSAGLVPIKNITIDMRIWDGEEWVSHEGIIDQGEKNVIEVGGVTMTPEHKILTEGGWIEGGKADGLNWANVQLPDGYPTCRKYQSGQGAMALSLYMWPRGYCPRSQSQAQEASHKVMWLHEAQTNWSGDDHTRNEPSSRLLGLALYETAMSGSKSPSVSQLRCARDHRVRPLVGELRELLGRYEPDMAEGTRSGQDRQQFGLQSRELPLDEQKAKRPKPAYFQDYQNTLLVATAACSNGVNRDRKNNAFIQNESRLAGRISVQETGCTEQVYDIRNCGPRHRFVVWNGRHFCIVSNCVQAVSRDILAYAMMSLKDERIVGHVHDELIIEARPEVSVESICERMGRTPPWLPGLELRADGYECNFYMKE